MNSLFKTLIAGYGAKKLGGGCFSTILIFVLIYYLLGHCGGNSYGRERAKVLYQKELIKQAHQHKQ